MDRTTPGLENGKKKRGKKKDESTPKHWKIAYQQTGILYWGGGKMESRLESLSLLIRKELVPSRTNKSPGGGGIYIPQKDKTVQSFKSHYITLGKRTSKRVGENRPKNKTLKDTA